MPNVEIEYDAVKHETVKAQVILPGEVIQYKPDDAPEDTGDLFRVAEDFTAVRIRRYPYKHRPIETHFEVDIDGGNVVFGQRTAEALAKETSGTTEFWSVVRDLHGRLTELLKEAPEGV